MRRTAALTLFLWLLLFAPRVAPAEEGGNAASEAIIQRVLDAWRQRRQAHGSATYELAGIEVVRRGAITHEPALLVGTDLEGTTADIPAADYRFKLRAAHSLDFAGNRYRREHHGEIMNLDEGTFHPDCYVDLYPVRR